MEEESGISNHESKHQVYESLKNLEEQPLDPEKEYGELLRRAIVHRENQELMIEMKVWEPGQADPLVTMLDELGLDVDVDHWNEQCMNGLTEPFRRAVRNMLDEVYGLDIDIVDRQVVEPDSFFEPNSPDNTVHNTSVDGLGMVVIVEKRPESEPLLDVYFVRKQDLEEDIIQSHQDVS